MMKRLCCTFVLALVGAIAGSVHAHGQDVGVAVQIQPAIGNGRFCLDVEGNRDRDGQLVYVFSCRGTENQRWTITSSVNNQRAIIGLGGYCLDVRGSNATANGSAVQIYQCHFGENQRFSLRPDGRIVEVRSGKCLSATGATDRAPVVLEDCKNTPQEVFVTRR